MAKHYITKRELINQLERQLHIADLTIVSAALLSSDGEINFITNKKNTCKWEKELDNS